MKPPALVSILFLVISTASYCFPQTSSELKSTNPVIVDRHSVQLSQSASESFAELLKKVKFEAITYMSDGLQLTVTSLFRKAKGHFRA